jgi:hypothetical protein
VWALYALAGFIVVLGAEYLWVRWCLKRKKEYALAWRRGAEAALADSTKAINDLHAFLQEAKKVKVKDETRES